MNKQQHIPSKLHLKVGDEVVVVAGNHKNKRGKIRTIDREQERAIVEGVNMRTRHIKPSKTNPQGRREKKEGSLHISNLMCIDPKTSNSTRIGRKYNDKNKLQRYGKKTGNFIP